MSSLFSSFRNSCREWGGALLSLSICLSLVSASIFTLSQKKTDFIFADFPDVSISYYQISGHNFSDLKKEMYRIGPEDLNGRRCIAYTSWKLDWKWPVLENKRPVPEYTEIVYKVEVTLPEWKEYKSAPKALQKKWDAFLHGVKQHERGHVEAFLKGAHHLKTELRSTPKNTPLSKLQRIAKAAVSELYNFDSTYDRRSLGGRTHGVLLR